MKSDIATDATLAATDGWHLDKRVPVSIILVLISQFVAGLWVIADMRKDIDVLKVQMMDTRTRQNEQTVQLQVYFSNVREDIKAVDTKLQRLIEKRP